MKISTKEVKNFWDSNPCGSKRSIQANRKKYFIEIERIRYMDHWHIPIIANFNKYKNCDVLEIGCGIGTDGLQFANNGARYTGIDLSPESIKIAKERFDLFGVNGKLEVANAEKLPFTDESFDHIYSFGVIHHSPSPEAIVEQMYRVLRPGGTFSVMIYNKSSINYHIEIMFLRKLFQVLLMPKFMPVLISKLTGFDLNKLQIHRKIMLRKRKLSKEEWININTDGPECPLAKVYNKKEACELFEKFKKITTEIWFFNKSHWPIIGRMLPKIFVIWLERRWGWHRIVNGQKPIYLCS